MERQGKYIYGVLNSNKELSFGPHGVSACEEVYNISYQDISAVVSDSEIVDYTHMRKDSLAMFLVRHQRAIEKIMSLDYTIIPIRLGTYAKDETEVNDILIKGYSLLKEIFDKINNKIEIDIAATWADFTSAIKEAGEKKEIKELKEKLLADPKMVTVDEQMKVGFMVKKALDEMGQNFVNQIHNTLKPVSQDVRDHELMNEEMVVNSAFLIDKSKRKEFDKRLEQLNAQFNEKLNFRCVGPLPPYSFYTLEIKKLEFEEIDWARKKLRLLNNFATRDEIKKAHQALAFSFHPDKNPNIPGIEKEFDEVTQAYKILLEYCRGENCYFDEQDFKKNAILVKVRE